MDVWSQEIPDEIGKYAILDRVDVGGMAEVFLGVDEDNELVAIKRILPQIAMKDQLVSMFIDEWRITAKLQHPNIAQIRDFGRAEKLYFMAMEFINGVDLRLVKHQFKKLRAEGDPRLTALAAYVISHICSALEYAYSKQDDMGQAMHVVHRDISPSNVLLSFDGDIKLIDFGVAKASHRAYKTRSKDLKGKFAYMSPEQARGKEVDNRSDIFGAGILLYELLTGKNPFAVGGGEFDTLERIATVQAPPPATLADVPPELDLCCQRALALDPEDRYGSAQTMEHVLCKFYEQEGFDREELTRWMREQLPNQYEKSLLVTSQRVAGGATRRWDALADREAPTTQRQASGELAQPVVQEHRGHRTSWLAIGIAAVVVLLVGLVVMNMMQDGPPAVAGPEPGSAAVETPAGRPALRPTPGGAEARPEAPVKEHAVMVLTEHRGAQCRAKVGEDKLVLKPAPCRIMIKAGARVELQVLADGFKPYSQTWTITGPRRLQVKLVPSPGARVPPPPQIKKPPKKAPLMKLPPSPRPRVKLPPANQAKSNPVTGTEPPPAVKVIRALGDKPSGSGATIVPGPKPAPDLVKPMPGSKPTPKPAPSAKPAPKPKAKPAPKPKAKPAPKPAPAKAKPAPPAKPAPKPKPRPKPKPQGLDDSAADWD